MQDDDAELIEALDHLKFGMDFAYKQGLGEFGYDPVETVRLALSRLSADHTGVLVDALEEAEHFILNRLAEREDEEARIVVLAVQNALAARGEQSPVDGPRE